MGPRGKGGSGNLLSAQITLGTTCQHSTSHSAATPNPATNRIVPLLATPTDYPSHTAPFDYPLRPTPNRATTRTATSHTK
jgi:hypothetical protein